MCHVHLDLITLIIYDDFSYLGAPLNNENRVSSEISQRIMAGNRAFDVNLPLLRSNLVSKTTKLKLYKKLI
jgi:hypothetical protein